MRGRSSRHVIYSYSSNPPRFNPRQLGTVAPEPVLFNFLVPGRDEKPFYGACLLMYRPASEAMPIDDDDVEVRADADLCFFVGGRG